LFFTVFIIVPFALGDQDLTCLSVYRGSVKDWESKNKKGEQESQSLDSYAITFNSMPDTIATRIASN